MLKLQSVRAGYGASQVLFDINLSIGEGEVVSLLGRNGMGKTTTIKSVRGLVSLKGGSIEFNGRSVTGLLTDQIAKMGIGLVPEGRRVFSSLSVEENLVVTHRGPKGAQWTLDAIYSLFPRLKERSANRGSQLSGGEQQMLAIGRALMTNPKLVILDEATEGLAPIIRDQIWAAIGKLKAAGQSILVVDKNLDALLRLADRHVIVQKGITVWTGNSEELQRAEDVRARYLHV